MNTVIYIYTNIFFNVKYDNKHIYVINGELNIMAYHGDGCECFLHHGTGPTSGSGRHHR